MNTRTTRLKHAAILLSAAVLAACGGGGDTTSAPAASTPAPAQPVTPAPPPDTTPPPTAQPPGEPVAVPGTPAQLAVAYDVKRYQFTWAPTADATRYELWEDADGPGPQAFVPLDVNLAQARYTLDHAVLMHRKLDAQYRVRGCNAAGCGSPTAALPADPNRAVGYFKGSGVLAQQQVGSVLTLSGDGQTLAVGRRAADSQAGEVHVFARSGGTWSEQARLTASNADAFDMFGQSVALSADGNTLAVGAMNEDSNAQGIDGDQDNDTFVNAGAVYVFTRTAGTWRQEAYVKASNTQPGNNFGQSVALSGDGSTLAVGSPAEGGSSDNRADQPGTTVPFAGAVYVFERSGGGWRQQAYLKAVNAALYEAFGRTVALSDDGSTVAVAVFSDNGGRFNAGASSTGQVDVLRRTGETWSLQARLRASNAAAGDEFGQSLALSLDGGTLAVGAFREDSAAAAGGDPADNSAADAGAAYVFTRSGGAWAEQAYLKAGNPSAGDFFGYSVSLSGSGDLLAVGAWLEDGSAAGLGGSPDDTGINTGATYLFAREAGAWTQAAYLKSPNADNQDFAGIRVGLSLDGNTLAVGANGDDSDATGVNGSPANSTAGANSGAVYLY